MKIISFIELCLTFSIVYITIGDSFLPQPYNENSKVLRHNINQFLGGLFPEKEFNKLKKSPKFQ